jgi:ubiquinone/menaquinone biosynthesis C-methylase UbiE
MAYENRERNRWIVTFLDLQPDDHMLEVGFGPGLAIQYVSEKIVKGFVAGIDSSTVMVKLASKRNVSTVREGRANLTYGSVSALPCGDNSFDKVFAINSMHHWPEPREGLKEVRRVLKPGGLIAIAEHFQTRNNLDI